MFAYSPTPAIGRRGRAFFRWSAVAVCLWLVVPALGSGSASAEDLLADVEVLSPNGGEELYWAKIHGLRWDAPAQTDSVVLRLSTDNAATWEEIASGEPNDGYYSWKIPEVSTDSALVKVEAYDGLSMIGEDVSDGLFAILPDTLVNVISPNGGEELFWGDTHGLRWSAPAHTDTVVLSLSTDNAATWEEIASGEPNDGYYSWTVPEVRTDSALVKVEAFYAGAPINDDVSDGLFKILADTTVEVISPNGGEELYFAKTHLLRWSAPAQTDTVVLRLSTDNGAGWEDISSGESNDGFYSWKVPEVRTDSALVKVIAYDAGIPIGEDLSDGVFTIRPDTVVEVISPNGGEELYWGDLHGLRWTAPAHTDTVVLSFSADSAATWEEIASGEPNDGYYSWTVPEVFTDSALVKVVAYYSGLPINEDVSDGMFAISPETEVIVISPNGGEDLYWSETHNIQWAAPAHSDTVVLSLSTDNAATWEKIASGEPNDGVYSWTVPKVLTDSALVRVEAYDAGLPIGEDISDGLFRISPDTTIEVISPIGGEELLWAEIHGIRWTAPAHTDTVVLSFSADSAATWEEIASGEPNDGYYSWTVPEVLTDSALVKVEAYYSGIPIGEDTSDSVFTIRPDTTVLVVSPNGGEDLYWGDLEFIQWAAPAHTDTVVLSLSADSAATWEEVASGEPNDGFYSWTVPEVLTDSALVKVEAYYSGAVIGEDTSDGLFTIGPESTVVVISPNGGEDLHWAETHTVQWAAPAQTDTVVLSLSVDNAATWEEIASGEPNDGFYSWIVPEVLTDSALVKVEAYDAGSPIGEDVSDGLFTISPDTTVAVVSPNGGENLYWAETKIIQWTAPAHTDTVVLSFSPDSAATWEEIASGEANDGFYSWTVPEVLTDSALVRVEAYDGGLPIGEDASDGIFGISPDTTVAVLSPNGGEDLLWAETHNLQWTAPAHTDTVVLSFSPDSAATWEEITSGELNDGLYLWTVPEVLTDSALVRIEAYYGGIPIGVDISDGLFRVLPGTTVAVVSPNGGEELYWAETHGLRWTAPAHTDTVVLSLSVDNAATWEEIASGEPNDELYPWTVPEVLTDSALVKVEAHYGGMSIGEDTSDGLFRILPGTTIAVLSPNGGEELHWAETKAIQWNAPAHTDTVVLSFSPDRAATWEEIASGEPNDGFYMWTVPEVLTDSALVKVEAYYGGTSIGEDASDAVFGISPDTTVVVAAPNGGEELTWPGTYGVQWTAPAHTDTVVLMLSTDNAATWDEISSGEPNDGYYSWTIPQVTSDSALVRVEAYYGGVPIGDDSSDGLFSISPDTTVDVPGRRPGLGDAVVLWQNAPNPWRSGTNISFYLPEEAVVYLYVFDAKGRLVDVLIDGARRGAGVQTVPWNGRRSDGARLGSGVYFYRLKVGGFVETRKMILAQ